MGVVTIAPDLLSLMPTPHGRKPLAGGPGSPAKARSIPHNAAAPMLDCGLSKDLEQDVVLIASRPLYPPRAKKIGAEGSASLLTTASPTTPRDGNATVHNTPEASPVSDTKCNGKAVASRRLPNLPPTMNALPIQTPGQRALHAERPGLNAIAALQRPARAAVVCEGGCSADDCVDADRVPLSMQTNGERGCYRLRKISVSSLQRDGTLGLLLHGTSIVGFRCAQAEVLGWQLGDQIVEINGRRAGNFDEFQECFRNAQREDGFPIQFSVLRREDDVDQQDKDNAEDALASFFSTTDFANLAGQMKKRWGEQAEQVETESHGNAKVAGSTDAIGNGTPCKPAGTPNYTMDNPYIIALQRRRDALLRTNDGWAKWADDDHVEASESVAAQLAQKQDGMAILNFRWPAPETETREREYCGLFCSPNCSGARGFEHADFEMAATPRFLRYDTLHTRFDFDEDDHSRDPPWATEAASMTSRASVENDSREADSKPWYDAQISGAAKLEPVSVSELEVQSDTEPMADDAAFLAQLLLTSDEFYVPSDGESEDDRNASPSPQNIAVGLVTAVKPGSVGI